MRISTSMRWLVVAVSAAMLLAVAAACAVQKRRGPRRDRRGREEVIKEVRFPARPSWSRRRLSRR